MVQGTFQQPVLADNLDAFRKWLANAPAGSWCVYWLGRMAEENKGLACPIGTAAMEAFEDGKVLLTQRKDNAWVYSYLAVKRKALRPKRARLVHSQPAAHLMSTGRVPPRFFGDKLDGKYN